MEAEKTTMKSLKVVALVSGGKDSCYSMLQCVAAGHEIVALANLRPKDASCNELDSYMFQSVGHQAIDLYAEAMDLPLFRRDIEGSSVNIQSDYCPTETDEVEDLYCLLSEIKSQLNFDAVCSGAILSNYQRVRVENVCSRLNLVSLGFLWRRDQSELLDEMIDNQIEAVIIKVATLGLDQSHLGKSLKELRNHLHKMSAKFGINVCGEGGEYETFTLDCPLFVKKIIVKESQIMIHSQDAFAPVAFLKFKTLSLEDKKGAEKNLQLIKSPHDFVDLESDIIPESAIETNEVHADLIKKHDFVANDKWFCVSNITSDKDEPSEATSEIFQMLKRILEENKLELNQILAVTLLLADMNHFPQVNKAYVMNFGLNPPVRVCVQAPMKQTVSLTCFGNQMEKIETMHVQSISHWAPANIGPYSQANLVENDGILHVAGQIGLIPGSMELPEHMDVQALLSMRHLMRILEVYGMNARNIVQLVCYVTCRSFYKTVRDVWLQQFSIEEEKVLYGHLLTVAIMPKLPRDAKVEWHAIASLHVPELAQVSQTCLTASTSNNFVFSKHASFEKDMKWQPTNEILRRTLYFKAETPVENLKNCESYELFPVLSFADENINFIANSMSYKSE